MSLDEDLPSSVEARSSPDSVASLPPHYPHPDPTNNQEAKQAIREDHCSEGMVVQVGSREDKALQVLEVVFRSVDKVSQEDRPEGWALKVLEAQEALVDLQHRMENTPVPQGEQAMT